MFLKSCPHSPLPVEVIQSLPLPLFKGSDSFLLKQGPGLSLLGERVLPYTQLEHSHSILQVSWYRYLEKYGSRRHGEVCDGGGHEPRAPS